MNLFNRFFNLGVRAEYEESLNRKIRIGNRLAFIFVTLSVLYTIAIIIRGIPIAYIPFAGVPTALSVLVFNHWGYVNLSRLIASTAPTIVATLYHIALMQPDEEPLISSYIFATGLMIIPFVLFDYKERIYLIMSFLLCLVLVLSVRPLNGLIDIPMDNSPMRTASYERAIIVLTGLLAFINLLVMQRVNYKSEMELQDLIKEKEAQNQKKDESEVELKGYLEQIEQSKEREEKRAWVTKGLSDFGEILRGSQGLQDTGDELIAELVTYLGADLGAVYILNEVTETDEPYLTMLSCYAYERKKFIDKKIGLGEGLVGQSILERDVLYLTDTPDDYLDITSGLGRSKPVSIMVVPLLVGEDAYGAIELAAFKEIPDYKKDFVKQLGESIASTFLVIQNNNKTQDLLEEVQNLNKSYKRQEEKMLHEMQELMQRNNTLIDREQKCQEELIELKKQLDTFSNASASEA